MRKRQIEVDATTLKPRTRFYPYFDGQSMSDFVHQNWLKLVW